MHEVELKFQVPLAGRHMVDGAVAGRTPQRRIRLQAHYCDTPERSLAAAGIALRVRREGRQWVQTLKGAADDGMTRLEHNVVLAVASGTVPAADPWRHAGTAAGAKLLALLADQPVGALQVLFRTDILRRTRVLRTRAGSVELAFDEGRIHAGHSTLPVCELEIELKSGSPQAVIDTARRWVPRFGLWLDTRSKAERGDLLSRGQNMAPARAAQPVKLLATMTPQQALRAVLRSCAGAVRANASQIASGSFDAEHVHQLRVGLRRLRSALSLFEPAERAEPEEREPQRQALADAAATLFRRLGGARDRAVLQGGLAAELLAEWRSVDTGGGLPQAMAPAEEEPPVDVARDSATQALLLDLLLAGGDEAGPARNSGEAHAPAQAHAEESLRCLLASRLNHWHRGAAADARRFAALDDTARHGLRKHIKRLRYAVEFSSALFKRRAVRAYLRPLLAVQERLGALNDVVMATAALRPAPPADAASPDPHVWFALGWLAARREALAAASLADLARFTQAKRFWKAGKGAKRVKSPKSPEGMRSAKSTKGTKSPEGA